MEVGQERLALMGKLTRKNKNNGYLLTLDMKALRLQVNGKHSAVKEFEVLIVRGKKLFILTSL